MGSESGKAAIMSKWDWWGCPQPPPGDINQKRRVRALVETSVMLVTGMILYFFLKWPRMGTIAFCLAAFVGISGMFIPSLYRGMKRFVDLSAAAVGRAMTWVVLTPFFYICFTPGRLMQILRGKDPMCRQFPGKEASYWVHRPPPRPDHFRRQF